MSHSTSLTTFLCTSLIILVTACGTTTGGTKPGSRGGPGSASLSCGEPVVFVLPLRDDTGTQCIYRAEQTFGDCLLGKADILGSGAAAGPVNLRWARTGGTVDAAGGPNDVALTGDTWAKTGVNQFDTSAVGAGDGTYEVVIDRAGNECALYGNVSLSIKTDANN